MCQEHFISTRSVPFLSLQIFLLITHPPPHSFITFHSCLPSPFSLFLSLSLYTLHTFPLQSQHLDGTLTSPSSVKPGRHNSCTPFQNVRDSMKSGRNRNRNDKVLSSFLFIHSCLFYILVMSKESLLILMFFVSLMVHLSFSLYLSITLSFIIFR